jgi:hypothetical protein
MFIDTLEEFELLSDVGNMLPDVLIQFGYVSTIYLMQNFTF